MSIKVIFWCTYGAIVVLGTFYLIGLGRPEFQLVAMNDMPAGHAVVPGDLSFQPERPIHLKHAVRQGDIVDTNSLTDHFEARVFDASVPFAIQVGAQENVWSAMNANLTLHICPEDVEARLRSLHCAVSGRQCVAVLDVPPDKHVSLTEAERSSLTIAQACAK